MQQFYKRTIQKRRNFGTFFVLFLWLQAVVMVKEVEGVHKELVQTNNSARIMRILNNSK